jgi:hypothetical protein
MASKVKSSDQVASIINVEDAGRDEVLGFASARWVELSDEEHILNGLSGVLLEVDTVTGTTVKVKNPTNAALTTGTNPVLRRWDGAGEVKASIATLLEDGVEIEFDGGMFAAGDYWMFPARTLTGRVEWPADGTAFELRQWNHASLLRAGCHRIKRRDTDWNAHRLSQALSSLDGYQGERRFL